MERRAWRSGHLRTKVDGKIQARKNQYITVYSVKVLENGVEYTKVLRTKIGADALPQKPWKERLYDLKCKVLRAPQQRMYVNRKYCPQVQESRDLKRAIKEGHLVVHREARFGSDSRTNATYVTVK